MKNTQPIQRCKVALINPREDVLAPAHWLGQYIAITAPAGKDRSFTPKRGHWMITHRASGLSAGSLLCTKRKAVKIARAWDQCFASIDPAAAKNWEHGKAWVQLVRGINAPNVSDPQPADGNSQDTAGELAARLKLPIDQAGGSIRIFWRGKFWPAPTDAELEFWTFDGCF